MILVVYTTSTAAPDAYAIPTKPRVPIVARCNGCSSFYIIANPLEIKYTIYPVFICDSESTPVVLGSPVVRS